MWKFRVRLISEKHSYLEYLKTAPSPVMCKQPLLNVGTTVSRHSGTKAREMAGEHAEGRSARSWVEQNRFKPCFLGTEPNHNYKIPQCSRVWAQTVTCHVTSGWRFPDCGMMWMFKKCQIWGHHGLYIFRLRILILNVQYMGHGVWPLLCPEGFLGIQQVVSFSWHWEAFGGSLWGLAEGVSAWISL